MLLAWGGFPFVEDFDLETLPRLLLQGFLSTLRINADSVDSVAVPENDTSSLSSRTFCCIHCSSLSISQPLISSMVGSFAAGFARPAGELHLGFGFISISTAGAFAADFARQTGEGLVLKRY